MNAHHPEVLVPKTGVHLQGAQQHHGILSAGYTDTDHIPVFDQVIVLICAADLAQDRL